MCGELPTKLEYLYVYVCKESYSKKNWKAPRWDCRWLLFSKFSNNCVLFLKTKNQITFEAGSEGGAFSPGNRRILLSMVYLTPVASSAPASILHQGVCDSHPEAGNEFFTWVLRPEVATPELFPEGLQAPVRYKGKCLDLGETGWFK